MTLAELTEPLTSVLNYWRGLGGEELACSWPQFNLVDLPPQVLPTTLVVDVFDDMSKNRFRYWGSKMTEIHGADMTGRSPYDMSPRDFAEDLRNQHSEIRTERTASADTLGFIHERGFDHMHTVLRMPLSNDGHSVDHIVGVVWYTDEALRRIQRNGDLSADDT
ncbi:MAG: hypothetical protein RIA64_08420 [Rhodospirillales bacterium]